MTRAARANAGGSRATHAPTVSERRVRRSVKRRRARRAGRPLARDLRAPVAAATGLSRGFPFASPHDMTWLSTLSPWDATWMACAWAVSDNVQQRLAIANALPQLPRLVGATFVLEHLASDQEPAVRDAAARAAALLGRAPALLAL
jgi:hypothetical protein